ncbi:MAG: MASE2 domain-containing protein, partial [Betaproteobacteria bacterium]
MTTPFKPHIAAPFRASAAHPAGASRTHELAFVGRVFRLRVVGLGLGALCVAPVLWLQGSGWWWLLLACNALAWPHLA